MIRINSYESFLVDFENRLWVNAYERIIMKNLSHLRDAESSNNEELTFGLNFIKAVENAVDAIVVVLHNEVIAYANPCALELVEQQKINVIGSCFKKFFTDADYKRVSTIMRKRLSGEEAPNRYDTVLITRSGKSIDVEFTVSKTVWGESPAVLVIIRKN
jgi:PAS domain S-box-containing protein